MDETKDLVTTEHRELATELSITDVRNQVAKIQQLMHEVLQEGQHYGTIPGAEKPSLFKPGAEKINFMFRLGTGKLDIVKLDFDNGHREITVTTPIIHIPTNTVVAYGIGSCSTLESKYRYRNGAKKCPACGKETIIKGKEEYGGGWVCYAKKGGCNAKYKENDTAITSQAVGKIENPDIADVYNTVLKMAAKRSYVDGTIKASAASDFFTQDIEDFVEEEQPIAEKKTQTKPIKPSQAETVAQVFSGTVEDAQVTKPHETTKREILIQTLQFYVDKGLVKDAKLDTINKMLEWLDNTKDAETNDKKGKDGRTGWEKAIENLKQLETVIPEEFRRAHGLYKAVESEQQDIF